MGKKKVKQLNRNSKGTPFLKHSHNKRRSTRSEWPLEIISLLLLMPTYEEFYQEFQQEGLYHIINGIIFAFKSPLLYLVSAQTCSGCGLDSCLKFVYLPSYFFVSLIKFVLLGHVYIMSFFGSFYLNYLRKPTMKGYLKY